MPGTKPPSEQQAQSLRAEVFRYLAAGGLVIATGVAAWAVEQRAGDSDTGGQKPEGPGWRWDAQIYGWLSAALYCELATASSLFVSDCWFVSDTFLALLSPSPPRMILVASRVPQIFKNRQTKCEGLSLALFLFAVAGNLTYVASILLKTTDREYLSECHCRPPRHVLPRYLLTRRPCSPSSFFALCPSLLCVPRTRISRVPVLVGWIAGDCVPRLHRAGSICSIPRRPQGNCCRGRGCWPGARVGEEARRTWSSGAVEDSVASIFNRIYALSPATSVLRKSSLHCSFFLVAHWPLQWRSIRGSETVARAFR